MKLKRVVVVYKKSAYDLYARERRDRRFLQLLKADHLTSRRFVRSHESHTRALEEVGEILRDFSVETDFVYRARPFSYLPFLS